MRGRAVDDVNEMHDATRVQATACRRGRFSVEGVVLFFL